MHIALVAAGAFHFIMLPAQWVLCLFGVVKNYVLPALFDVAGFALRTEVAFMLVILLMAGIT